MNDLVTLNTEKEIGITTSLKIAESFDKKHKNVLQALQSLECSEQFSRRNFQPREYKKRGRNYPFYEITRDGFVFLVMGFTGSRAAEWKEKYINLFNLMEKKIRQISIERGKSDWQVSRSNGRIHRRGLTDAIAPFIIYAENQESYGTAKHAYRNLTRLVHKHCAINDDERDIVSAEMLRRIATLEGIVELKLIELMEQKIYCKDIYKLIKETLITFCDLVPFNSEKYLPKEERTLFPDYRNE